MARRIIWGLLIAMSSNAFAYQSVFDTGEIVPAGKYRVMGELQYLGDPSGLNLTAGMDAGVNESSNIRAVAGVGSVNLYAGVFYKWVPFPDTDTQPAIGIMGGGTWARYDGENYPGIRIQPIVSKKIDTEFGFINPYASLPFGVISGPRNNTFPFQFVVGTDWKPVDVENFSFLLEVGLNVNESASYVSTGLLYYIPE
jgi:hypothetical protein